VARRGPINSIGGTLGTDVIRLRVRRTFEADRIESILVGVPNWLGDAVLAIPTLANLRRSFPRARIAILVRAWVSDLFRPSPFVDELLEVPSRNQLSWAVTSLRRRRFGLAVLLPNNFRTALLGMLAGIPHRIGYMTDLRGPLLTVGVCPSGSSSMHQMDSFLGLLRALRWDAWEHPPRLTIRPVKPGMRHCSDRALPGRGLWEREAVAGRTICRGGGPSGRSPGNDRAALWLANGGPIDKSHPG
jgi:hypothetical protein